MQAVGLRVQDRDRLRRIGRRSERVQIARVEPLVAERSGAIRLGSDRWTIATRDGGWTAHCEHTIVVTADGALVLTALPTDDATTH